MAHGILKLFERQHESSHTTPRPETLQEFIGHEVEVRQLIMAHEAAQRNREMLRHVLLYGPPGCGKTTLARLLVTMDEGRSLTEVAAPNMEPQRLVSTIFRAGRGGYLLIDEIHAMPTSAKHLLYSVLEDGILHTATGPIESQRLTIIAATTNHLSLEPALRDRFWLQMYISPYAREDIARMAHYYGPRMKLTITDEGADELARWARATPRVLLHILSQVRDMTDTVTPESVWRALAMMGIDPFGFTHDERRYIQILRRQPDEHASLSILSTCLHLPPKAVQEIETELIAQGIIGITSRGRVLGGIGLHYAEYLEMTDVENALRRFALDLAEDGISHGDLYQAGGLTQRWT